MRLRYVGPHDEVIVPDANGGLGMVVKHNHQFEVEDALGKSLLRQESNYREVVLPSSSRSGAQPTE